MSKFLEEYQVIREALVDELSKAFGVPKEEVELGFEEFHLNKFDLLLAYLACRTKVPMVKALREATGGSLVECREALKWTGWDMEKAKDRLVRLGYAPLRLGRLEREP